MYSQVANVSYKLATERADTSIEQISTSLYPSRLSFYQKLPDLEISIDDFETFALDRLKVLKEIELAYIRGPTPKDIQKRIIEVATKYLPLSGRKHKIFNSLIAERKKDYLSHFILRLSFSRTQELRLWLVKQESLLFKARFLEYDAEDRDLFFKNTDLNLSPQFSKDFWKPDSYYKVNFEDALDLVTQRKIVIKMGFAYVPGSELVSLLTEDFKKRLDNSMIICSRSLPLLEGDDRLLPVLQNMSAQYNISEYQSTGSVDEITANDIENYGLFLKGIGLKLPEALKFWRNMFSRKYAEDLFNKDYAYNIRHSYGMEGKRANYSPYSCKRVITQNQPGSGDYHGCPFRSFNSVRLQQFLTGVTNLSSPQSCDSQIAEIVDLAKKSHFQSACTRFLELQISNRQKLASNSGNSASAKISTFVSDPSPASSQVFVEGISHPNSYFETNILHSPLAHILKPQ
ncbi:hypothetical protein BB561_002847 [Smittium simulii]|uniref:DNA primase large subunit C-terminal domain-containing protein n=1 Tax=Smittium simulii TaxID=133385 RepID=A0A2T9YNY1_9FUNG|nr:hypothetical protein BB561_002847 [Smittium simulii]